MWGRNETYVGLLAADGGHEEDVEEEGDGERGEDEGREGRRAGGGVTRELAGTEERGRTVSSRGRR